MDEALLPLTQAGFCERHGHHGEGWALTSAERAALKICFPLRNGVLVASGQTPEAVPKHQRTVLQHVLMLQREGWEIQTRRSRRNLPPPFNPTEEELVKVAFIFRGCIYRYYFQALAFATELAQVGWPSIPHGRPAAYYRQLFDDAGQPQAPGSVVAGTRAGRSKLNQEAASLGLAIEVDQDIPPPSRKQRRTMPQAQVAEAIDERTAERGIGVQSEPLVAAFADGADEIPGDVLVHDERAVATESEDMQLQCQKGVRPLGSLEPRLDLRVLDRRCLNFEFCPFLKCEHQMQIKACFDLRTSELDVVTLSDFCL